MIATIKCKANAQSPRVGIYHKKKKKKKNVNQSNATSYPEELSMDQRDETKEHAPILETKKKQPLEVKAYYHRKPSVAPQVTPSMIPINIMQSAKDHQITKHTNFQSGTAHIPLKVNIPLFLVKFNQLCICLTKNMSLPYT